MPLRQLPRDSELVESGGIRLFQNDPVSTAANAHALLLQMPPLSVLIRKLQHRESTSQGLVSANGSLQPMAIMNVIFIGLLGTMNQEVSPLLKIVGRLCIRKKTPLPHTCTHDFSNNVKGFQTPERLPQHCKKEMSLGVSPRVLNPRKPLPRFSTTGRKCA